MAVWVCGNEECGTRYSVGADRCPHCGHDNPLEEGTMAKIAKDAGPSNVHEDRFPPVLTEDGERLDRQDAEQTDAEHVSWTDLGRENTVGTVVEPGQGTPAEGTAAQNQEGSSDVQPDTDQDDDENEGGEGGGGALPTSDPRAEDSDVDEAFDPGQHTVADVNEYLEATDDPAERQRVIAAERAGRNRSGIRG